MRLVTDGDKMTVEVTLSERNLRSLLSKLEWKGSTRTLVSNDSYERTLTEALGPTNVTLVVVAETDEQHYSDRAHGPGPMHPKTEEAIR